MQVCRSLFNFIRVQIWSNSYMYMYTCAWFEFGGYITTNLSNFCGCSGPPCLPFSTLLTSHCHYPLWLHPSHFCSGFMSTLLGSLPPPASLSSVPLFVSLAATHLFLSHLLQPHQSAVLSIRLSFAYLHRSLILQRRSQLAHNTPHVSSRIDIVSSNRSDSTEFGAPYSVWAVCGNENLLADNIALLNQLSSLHGTLNLPLCTLNPARLRQVPSLVSWLYCFNTYVAVQTSNELIVFQ